MIVSENGTFLNMDLPKRGASMAPMKTKVEKGDILDKRFRHETQMKDDGMLLEANDFVEWKTKIDKLKQIVRQHQPTDLVVQTNTFTLSKRRAQTYENRNIADSILSKQQQVADDLDNDGVETGEGFDVETRSNGDDGYPINETDEHAETSEIHNSGKLEQPAILETQMSKARLVQQDSCLGYVYARPVVEDQLGNNENYGSRLGIDNRIVLRTDSRQKARPPVASNLENLLTHPKKFYDKTGGLMGYEGLKYPMSAFEEALDRQRRQLRSASIHSPSFRPSGKESQLSGGDFFSQRSSVTPIEARAAQVEVLMERNLTPKLSETASLLIGWGSTPQLNHPETTIVQSKRVGGATFQKNTNMLIGSTPELKLPMAHAMMVSFSKQKSTTNIENPQKKKMIAQTKEEKMRRKYAGEKKSERLVSSELANYPPLQLSNLNMLISNLGKTGDIQQANKQAIRATQMSKMRRSSRQQKPLGSSTDVNRALATELKRNSPASFHGQQAMYVTDANGNILQVSKSAIFEQYQDQNYNRMMPKLHQGQCAASLSSEMEILQGPQASEISPNGQHSKTRLMQSNRKHPQVLLSPLNVSQAVGNNKQERQVSYHYLSQQKFANSFNNQVGSKTGLWFAPRVDSSQMIVTGGHAQVTNMIKAQRGRKSKREARREKSLQSNQDLGIVDPSFTIASPTAQKKKKVINTVTSQETLLGGGFSQPGETASTNILTGTHIVSKTTRMQQSAVHWQVVSQNQQELVIQDSFTKQSFRETCSIPIETTQGQIAADSHRKTSNRQSCDRKSDSDGCSPTGGVQNIKDYIVLSHQQQRRQSEGTASPVMKTCDASMQCSSRLQHHTASSQDEQHLAPIGKDSYRASTQMMPIVISKTSHGNQYHQKQTSVLQAPQQTMLQQRGKDMVRTKRLDSGDGKPAYPMLMDDDENSVQDIVTFMGDSQHSIVKINEGKTRDPMPCDTMKLVQNSPKETSIIHQIEIASSPKSNAISPRTDHHDVFIDQGDSFGSNEEAEGIEIEESNPQQTGTLHADSRRQTIQMVKPMSEEQNRSVIGPSNCTIELKGRPMMIELELENDYASPFGQKQNNAITQTLGSSEERRMSKTGPQNNLEKEEAQDYLALNEERGTVTTPMTALIIHNGEKQEVMMSVNPVNMNPSIIVNMEQLKVQNMVPSITLGFSSPEIYSQDKNNKIQSPISQNSTESQQVITINNAATTTGPFRNKKQKHNSLQRKLVEQRNKLVGELRSQNMALSSVCIQPQPKQEQFSFSPDNSVNQKGFLPKMYHNSNFARTQKAIKQIREGPARKRQREQEQAFMSVNDYQVNNGMLAPGEPNQSPDYPETVPFLAGSALTGIKDSKFNATVSGSIPKRIYVKKDDLSEDGKVFTLRADRHTNHQSHAQHQPLADSCTSPMPNSGYTTHAHKMYQLDQNKPESPQTLANFAEKQPLAQPLESPGSNKNSGRQTPIAGWKGLSDVGSAEGFAETPYLSTKMLQHTIKKDENGQRINIVGHETQKLANEDYSMDGKNQTLLMQPERLATKEIIAPNDLPLVTGSITITRNSPSKTTLDRLCGDKPANVEDQNYSLEVKQIDSDNGKEGQARQQRQVIVHKLTLAPHAKQTFDKKAPFRNDESLAFSQPNSPFEREKLLNATGVEYNTKQVTVGTRESKDVIDKEQASSYLMRKTSETLQDPRLSNWQANETAYRGNQQNIINLWAIPSLNNQNIQSQANMTQEVYQGGLNVVINHSTTASKQINNAENKARQFIERQRKRTATLGVQRHQRYQYNPNRAKLLEQISYKSSSPTPPTPITADGEGQDISADLGLNETTAPQLIGKHLKPSVLDLNGDSLYNSGLLISTAPLAQNQAKQPINRKGMLGQALSKNQNEPKAEKTTQQQNAPAATYLASYYSQASKDVQTMTGQIQSERQVPECTSPSQPPQVQLSMNHQFASLTRINHQVLNTNPRLLAPSQKSPKRYASKAKKLENMIRDPIKATDQLILQGNVLLNEENRRRLNSDGLIDPESLKYRDFLRGAGDVDSSSTMRAYTPTLDNWHKQQQMNDTRQTVQVFARRSNGSNKWGSKHRVTKNTDIMAGQVTPISLRRQSPSESRQ